jgi:isochorismate synthase EntC
LRKLVLARAVDQDPAPGTTAVAVLARLHAHAAGATVYAHDLDDGSLFLGATPELLFAASGTAVTTMALAGSAARPTANGGDEAADQQAIATLISSTKERKEHGIVVEHLVQVLRPRSRPFGVPGGPHARLLRRLIHLETNLAAELRAADYFELLGALHPTPAVCGLPTPMARTYLSRHEHLQRGLYSGALGWSTPADCRFVVPLRGAIVREATAGGRGGDISAARLFAGAGIVETSVPAQELHETEMKFDVFRAALTRSGETARMSAKKVGNQPVKSPIP